ncbi:MAG: hypothetical protein ACJ75H_16445 [Thermoanaerobaculia bacterium]
MTMNRDALDRWLDAEREDRAGDADEALLELFAALPLAAPPAGFAERVMARAGLAVAPARRDLFASRPLRALLALAVAATAFGLLWLPPVLSFLAGLWSLSGFVQAGTRALVDASRWLAEALRFWDLLLTIGGALAEPLASPQVLAVLLVSLGASGLAFRYLRDQISGERNWTYVDPD